MLPTAEAGVEDESVTTRVEYLTGLAALTKASLFPKKKAMRPHYKSLYLLVIPRGLIWPLRMNTEYLPVSCHSRSKHCQRRLLKTLMQQQIRQIFRMPMNQALPRPGIGNWEGQTPCKKMSRVISNCGGHHKKSNNSEQEQEQRQPQQRPRQRQQQPQRGGGGQRLHDAL